VYVVLSRESEQERFFIIPHSAKSCITHDAYAGDEASREIVHCGLIYFETFRLYEKTFDFKDAEGSPFCRR
jgi:hypothetical protein